MLKALGIKEAFDEYKNDVGIVTKSKGGPRKSKILQKVIEEGLQGWKEEMIQILTILHK